LLPPSYLNFFTRAAPLYPRLRILLEGDVDSDATEKLEVVPPSLTTAMDVAEAILPKFDEHSPVFTLSSPFFLSCFGLALSFLVLKSRYSTAKQRAWIITTMASGIMSLASLPFLWDFLTRGTVRDVRAWPRFAILMNRFFQGYLVV